MLWRSKLSIVKHQKDCISDLPRELISLILQELEFDDIQNVSELSRHWRVQALSTIFHTIELDWTNPWVSGEFYSDNRQGPSKLAHLHHLLQKASTKKTIGDEAETRNTGARAKSEVFQPEFLRSLVKQVHLIPGLQTKTEYVYQSLSRKSFGFCSLDELRTEITLNSEISGCQKVSSTKSLSMFSVIEHLRSDPFYKRDKFGSPHSPSFSQSRERTAGEKHLESEGKETNAFTQYTLVHPEGQLFPEAKRLTVACGELYSLTLRPNILLLDRNELDARMSFLTAFMVPDSIKINCSRQYAEHFSDKMTARDDMVITALRRISPTLEVGTECGHFRGDPNGLSTIDHHLEVQNHLSMFPMDIEEEVKIERFATQLLKLGVSLRSGKESQNPEDQLGGKPNTHSTMDAAEGESPNANSKLEIHDSYVDSTYSPQIKLRNCDREQTYRIKTQLKSLISQKQEEDPNFRLSC